ncbi:hypothetical protein OS493_031695 [Desmophyllum pertusum]|uniref:Mitochondria-eating protein n=1 Tax=Desmophyllum pertusum TaxID=174260 RepID=A0A9X0D122_9CNID|nr:hypothetical protein OS493_031695 [Desmophyllum pertusum]
MDAGRQFSPLDRNSVNRLKVIMKETAATCNIDALVERISSVLRDRDKKGRFEHYTKDFLDKPEMKSYVEECCRYAWKLVCQTPPYEIQGNADVHVERDAVFNPAVHQVCRESVPIERSSGYIDLVVWPGLFEGSSGRIIRKTEVVLQSK